MSSSTSEVGQRPQGDGLVWDRFLILVSRYPDGPDTRRVVFERRDPAARDEAGRPAAVILRATGDLIVRFIPPETEVDGVRRDDYLRKAVEVVKARSEG